MQRQDQQVFLFSYATNYRITLNRVVSLQSHLFEAQGCGLRLKLYTAAFTHFNRKPPVNISFHSISVNGSPIFTPQTFLPLKQCERFGCLSVVLVPDIFFFFFSLVGLNLQPKLCRYFIPLAGFAERESIAGGLWRTWKEGSAVWDALQFLNKTPVLSAAGTEFSDLLESAWRPAHSCNMLTCPSNPLSHPTQVITTNLTKSIFFPLQQIKIL